MGRGVQLSKLVHIPERSLVRIHEHRTGDNTVYEIKDAGLSAFSVFFTQSPSFRAHQRARQRKKHKLNARSLFGVGDIPSAGQTRNILDAVDPAQLREAFWDVYVRALARAAISNTRNFSPAMRRSRHCWGSAPISISTMLGQLLCCRV